MYKNPYFYIDIVQFGYRTKMKTSNRNIRNLKTEILPNGNKRQTFEELVDGEFWVERIVTSTIPRKKFGYYPS